MNTVRNELSMLATDVDARCTRCMKCVRQCAFLKEKGAPGEIAEQVRGRYYGEWPNAFECSLCGLCGAVCPEGLKPDELFIAMRRVREAAGALDLAPYSGVLNFEGRGNSERYSFLNLPSGGETILFPGCGMSATRPQTVRRLFGALQQEMPQLGVGLGCCLKPSHDLGRVAFFEEQFDRLHERFVSSGVKRVITACPNCQKVFDQYGGTIEVVTAYAVLDGMGFVPDRMDGGTAVIHDPCPQRHDSVSQDAVRSLAKRASIELLEMREERSLTRCCGEGGMVRSIRPDLARQWTEQRHEAAEGRRMVTSCSGCVGFLGGGGTTEHILDILFDSRPWVKRMGPLGSLARLNLKKWFRKRLS